MINDNEWTTVVKGPPRFKKKVSKKKIPDKKYEQELHESIEPQKTYGDKSCLVTFTVESSIRVGKQLDNITNLQWINAWEKDSLSICKSSPMPESTVCVFTTQNIFAEAVHLAFYEHYPLIISPDVIWITIVQGFANHVTMNSEDLRSLFVNFEGKKKIEIERGEFTDSSSPNNNWEAVFPEFTENIRKYIQGDIVDILQSDFSTTGPTEQIASHIALMDTMKHYFSYSMRCGCGFPSITLRGTVEDWKKIKEKANAFYKFKLDWWLKHLLPVLDQFIMAAEKKPDIPFWRSLCNIHGASGIIQAPITGWLQVFFPYLLGIELYQNEYLNNYQKSYSNHNNVLNYDKNRRRNNCDYGIKLKNFPPSVSYIPFTYKDVIHAKTHFMRFKSGIASIIQYPDNSIEPMIGWAVTKEHS